MGSGSTLMAAEETGRTCFGTELDPLHVDVAIRRWQNKTARDAVHAATGELFNERGKPCRLGAIVGRHVDNADTCRCISFVSSLKHNDPTAQATLRPKSRNVGP
jgi:hypothetical protein